MPKGSVDLGRKISEEFPSVAPSKKEIHFPSFHVRGKDLGLEDKDVGREIVVVATVKVESVETSVRKDKKTINTSFDVLNINLKPGKIPHYNST